MPQDRVLFECEPLGACRVLTFTGREAMNELPAFTLEVVTDADVDLEASVGSAAAVVITDDGLGDARTIQLVLTAVGYSAVDEHGKRLVVELSSPAWLLTLRSGHRIFQHKTTQQIVAAVLEGGGIGAAQQKWHLTGTYSEQVHVTQHGETDWEFVTRLLGEEGISLWWDLADDKGVLVFADHASASAPIEGSAIVPFEDPGGAAHRQGQMYELEIVHQWTHDNVHVRDFDVDNPDTFIEGQSGTGSFSYYEFPAHVPTAKAAKLRADVRLEQLTRLAEHALGASNCVRLQPGRSFSLAGSSDDAHDRGYVVVSVEHHVVEAGPAHAKATPYENEVVLVPLGDKPFRPAIPDAPPRIEGLQSAVTKGPAGDEIHVDDLGRVKLELRWDRAGIADDKSSRWVRCLQPNVVGSMMLPRVGWEVAIAFLHGSPDRPFVLGRLYNPVDAVPYGLPGAKTTSALKSNTSPGGGSVNELCLDDTAGAEHFGINASRDLSLMVGGDALWKVAQKVEHLVEKGHELIVKGAHTGHVGGSAKLAADKDYRLVVDGKRLNVVAAVDILKITGDRKVAISGKYGEWIGGAHLVECNQENTVVLGAFTQIVSGILAQTTILGYGESITGGRKEKVGASRIIKAGTDIAEGGRFCIGSSYDAGAVVEKGKAEVKLACAKGGTIKAGSAELGAGKKFAIEADEVMIKASEIEVENGPALKVASTVQSTGKTSTDATTTTKQAKDASED